MASLQSVLVTRPQGQGDTLIEKLRQSGYLAVSLPLIRIVPQQFNPPVLTQYQGIIVTSTNAVRHGVPLLIDQHRAKSSLPIWYAVGTTTQQALAIMGIKSVTVGRDTVQNSEALLELTSLHAIENQRFLILKGEGGRTTLRQTLLARNAVVDEACVYRRENPNYRPHEITTIWRKHLISTVVFTSVSCIENLVASASQDIRQLLSESCVIVASERIAEAFTNHGLEARNLRIAAGADDEALMAAIQAEPTQPKDQ